MICLIDCQLLLENLLIRVQYITQTDIMLVLFILCYLISYRHSPSYLQVHGYHFIWRFESWFSHYKILSNFTRLNPIRVFFFLPGYNTNLIRFFECGALQIFDVLTFQLYGFGEGILSKRGWVIEQSSTGFFRDLFRDLMAIYRTYYIF